MDPILTWIVLLYVIAQGRTHEFDARAGWKRQRVQRVPVLRVVGRVRACERILRSVRLPLLDGRICPVWLGSIPTVVPRDPIVIMDGRTIRERGGDVLGSESSRARHPNDEKTRRWDTRPPHEKGSRFGLEAVASVRSGEEGEETESRDLSPLFRCSFVFGAANTTSKDVAVRHGFGECKQANVLFFLDLLRGHYVEVSHSSHAHSRVEASQTTSS